MFIPRALLLAIPVTVAVACSDSAPDTPKSAASAEKAAVSPKAAKSKSKPKSQPGTKPVPSTKASPSAINESNWKNHPAIEEVRELVQQIQSAEGDGGWSLDRQKFADGCAEQGIYEVALNQRQGNIYTFVEVGGMGDLARTTTHYYDDSGQARFVMSEYSHSSAESTMVSRLYLAGDGAVLFAPKPEQVSKKSGPTDDMPIKDLLLAKSSDAKARHAEVVESCKQ